MIAYFTPLLLNRVDTAFLVGVVLALALALLGGVVWWVWVRKEFTEE